MRRSSPVSTIVGLVAVGASLVVWYYLARRGDRGRMSMPETAAFMLLRPVQRTLLAGGAWMGDVGRVLVRRSSIISQNSILQARLADARGQNLRLLRYRSENEELRRMLNMPRAPSGGTVAAEVVSLDATDFARHVVINAGRPQGIHPKDVVFTADGVVGQVLEVAEHGASATVVLVTDNQSGVGAMTSRTMAKGVVEGTGKPTCKLKYVDYSADLREGDLVVTSGESRKSFFPKGLVIGRVAKVERNKTYSQMSADILPAVPFDRLSAVFVRTRD